MNEKEVFEEYYKEARTLLEEALFTWNGNFIQEKNPLLKDNFQFFQSLNEEGKRIRGTLVMLGYYLMKNEMEYSIPLGVAYEVFQTAILVHDDIIDKDSKRRGKDTIHYANEKKYSTYGEIDDVRHFSNSIALCMGDYGLYSANKIIIDAYQKDEKLGDILSAFHDTVLHTIRGELLDVILPFESKNHKVKENDLEKHIKEIYYLKTAHYTIIGPLVVGMILGGAKSKHLEEITEFGEKVGIAFQIQDDILGIYSDEMGKVKGSDIKEFKQTILFSNVMKTKYKKEFLKVYTSEDLTEEKINKVKEILDKSGATSQAMDLMKQYFEEGIKLVNKMTWLDNEKKEILIGFVKTLQIRKK